MKTVQKSKIVVIGAGNVGEAIAYTLMVREQVKEIVLVDVNEDRARGAAFDIAHGTGFHKPVCVRQGGYEECSDAQLIIITAGIARKPGQTRLELAKINVSIAKSITESIMKYNQDPLILVVSNPADILTTVVQEVSGLPADRAIGSGTSLDTARFRYNLSRELGVSIEDIQAYITGEHGDSQVPVWSSATVAGFPLEEYAKQEGIVLDKAKIAECTKIDGAEIIRLKGATFYGVAMAVSSIAEAILKDNHTVLPVAHVLDESFGTWAGIAASLPCRIGSEGIEACYRISMNTEEARAMEKSVKVLQEFWNLVKEQ